MHKIIINRVSFVKQHKLYPTLFNVKKVNKKIIKNIDWKIVPKIEKIKLELLFTKIRFIE